MKEKPMLFSGEMVRAILEGRKTQTRRIVKPQPEFSGASSDSFEWHGGKKLLAVGYGAAYIHSNWTGVEKAMIAICQHPVGSIIWVKETFHPMPHLNAKAYFRATDPLVGVKKWTSPLFMRRQQSRIDLKVTGVIVERLQDISEADAKAEGCLYPASGPASCYRLAYRELWESINGKGSWALNPWVWVYEFQRIKP